LPFPVLTAQEQKLLAFDMFSEWAIPENIHTIPRTAFQNSEGKGGFFELEIQRHRGILTIGIPKAWGSF